jgi:predicted site-specific integrase-resolvase
MQHALRAQRGRKSVDPVYTSDALAERYGTTAETVKYWRRKGTGPRWFRAGKRVFFRESDVASWEAEQVEQAAARREQLSRPG